MAETICGLWVAADGRVHVSWSTPEGGRVERIESFRPFAWLNDTPADVNLHGLTLERLKGEGTYDRLVHADDLATFEAFVKQAKLTVGVDAIRPLESQFLLQHRQRVYRDLSFSHLRRCQLDIETGSEDGSFSDAAKPNDRVLAIGLRCGGKNRLLLLEAETDAGEKALLESFNAALAEIDPDVIEGHNLFKFDLDFLRQRCRLLRVPCAWGRFGQRAGVCLSIHRGFERRRSRRRIAARHRDQACGANRFGWCKNGFGNRPASRRVERSSHQSRWHDD